MRFYLFDAPQLGHFGNGLGPPEAFEHALGVAGAGAHAVVAGVSNDEQVQGAVQPGIATTFGLSGGDFLDQFSQGWPAKVLVLDVDELGRVVHRLQVERLDVAFAFLGLGAQDLGDLLRRAGVALQPQPELLGLARRHQVLAGLLEPGRGEVMVQVFEDGAADLAGDVLTRGTAPWALVGCRLVAFGTVQRCVSTGVPVFVEHVVAHDEADGAFREFVVDQHGLLVVRRGKFQGLAHLRADVRVEAFILHPVGNFSPFLPTETTTDECWQAVRDLLRRFVACDRTAGKPLAVFGILRLGGALQRPIGDTQRAFAGQVGFAAHPRQIEGHFPTQYPDLDAWLGPGLGQEEFTDARRRAVADEKHRRLEPPADDVDGLFGCRDGLVHGFEGFLAVDQRLIGSAYRMVFGVAYVPGRRAGGRVGVLQRDGHHAFELSHRVFSP
ncbi:hypothetical protein D3C85_945740 [compost metagenome]